MTYEQIETFLTIITCKTISAAAQSLYVSQSTVSTRIQQLEDELGVPLIIRQKGHRTIELTSYGRAFIPTASQWASLWKDTMQIKTAGAVETLHIASVDAVNNYTLVPLFQKHIQTYPNIRLNISTHHSNEIYGLVQSRMADIGFVFSQISYPDIVTKPIYRERMYLLCHKDSPYHDEISCEELKVENEIFLNWGHDYLLWHERHFSAISYPLISVNTGSGMQRYLDKPGRFAIAPLSVIKGAMHSNPDLVYYSLKETIPPRICYEIKNLYPNQSRKEIINVLEKELDEFISYDESISAY
ncbi:MAG: LysR family transcriptional regulator [Faecalicoccus sp.]|nr:LysR family transcriptional regulator [Faecalicoccus sp.]